MNELGGGGAAGRYAHVFQPYNTVMQIGYGSLLRGLATKQVTRLSELIVTGTLSFTLQPRRAYKNNKALTTDMGEKDILD